MTWWIASLISNVSIILTEYLNRTGDGNWVSVLPKTLPLIILAQWCLFRAFNGAPNWMIAWMMFTIGNAIMRVIAVNFMAGHEVGNWYYTLCGVSVMIAGSFLVKSGLH